MAPSTRFVTIAVTLLAAFVVSACGEGEVRVTTSGTGTGTTPTTTSPEPAAGEVPEGVAAQYAVLEEEIAAEGGSTESGEWRIAYIKEPAEGWFEGEDGRAVWREPARYETAHLEIIPIERETGRIVPYADVTLEVLDEDGKLVDGKPLRFYYAEFFHYAENFRIPREGEYALRATVIPPAFRRHGDEDAGPVLTERAQVEFENVRIEVDG
jgi:hypothetical protein